MRHKLAWALLTAMCGLLFRWKVVFFMFVEFSFILVDNLNMIKTYEIDLDDALVEEASDIFDKLGSYIDSAIKIFLKQAILKKGFPFEVVIPEEDQEKAPSPSPSSSDKEEAAAIPPVSDQIAARVAANEALVAEMRNEIGDKEVTPEFDGNDDDGTHGDYEQASFPAEEIQSDGRDKKEESPSVAESENQAENPASSSQDDEEDEDETTPDNLFDAWDVGDEEEIGCR